jgi:AcrR family transcriptional regulator
MSPRTAEQNQVIREERKRAIIEASLTVFAQKGYAASTIDQIAQEAKISKGLLYNYFGSKEDLLHAIFQYVTEQTEHLWQFDENLAAKAKLKQLLDATFYYLDQHLDVMRLMTQLALQVEAIGELKNQIDGSQTAKFLLMEPMLKEMGFDDPKEETFYIGAILDGIALGRMMLGEDYPYLKMKERLYRKYQLV